MRFGQRKPLEQSFWEKVEKADGCWLWKGGRNAEGYGNIWAFGKCEKAHRVSVFLHSGRWPSLCVLHKCDNPPCVRPDHLFEGTKSDNVQDALRKGRWNAGIRNKEKTRCIRGHEFTPANTYRLTPSRRTCRQCGAARARLKKLHRTARRILLGA